MDTEFWIPYFSINTFMSISFWTFWDDRTRRSPIILFSTLEFEIVQIHIVTDRSVNGGGGQPPGRNQGKNMQNVLKRKNMQKIFFDILKAYPLKIKY